MYDIIKRQNGERFAKAIRCYDNGVFEIPNLPEIVRHAGHDAEPILPYLISLKDIHITQTSEHHDPIALLNAAGYDAYVADTLEKQNAISKYFADGESLCTFRDKTRFERYYIINAVRYDVDKIRRIDFPNPVREDAYGTSVISIQISRQGGFISIKNRYNHTVDACDNTFNSNPDNIIVGLGDALQNYFGVDFSRRYDLPRGYLLANNQICKYAQEINNTYLGADFYVIDGVIYDINTQTNIMLGGGLVFNIETKTVRNVTDEFYETEFLDAAFRNRVFQQLKDKSTGIRTLTANGVPVVRTLNGEMTYINVPNAPRVNLSHMNKLSGDLDFSGVDDLTLSHFDTTNIRSIKFNPCASSIKIVHTALPAGDYDFSGVNTLVLNNADISRATSVLTRPNASYIGISNVQFPKCHFDFSGVHTLHLPNCDMRNALSIRFNPTAHRINLRGAKLPVGDYDFSRANEVVLDNADLSLVKNICIGPCVSGYIQTTYQR